MRRTLNPAMLQTKQASKSRVFRLTFMGENTLLSGELLRERTLNLNTVHFNIQGNFCQEKSRKCSGESAEIPLVDSKRVALQGKFCYNARIEFVVCQYFAPAQADLETWKTGADL